MRLEFCAENFTNIPAAIEQGARRIELCDNLAVGGTTPSYAVIEHAVDYASAHNATVMTMIRPRGGDFIYDKVEFELMRTDLKMVRKLNSHGVVFGCLNENHRIDRSQAKELIELSQSMEIVFHMAFDEIPRKEAKVEMDWLIEQGVTRILTHGGRGGTVEDHAEWLQELIEHADGRIEILIGGGVTYENVSKLAEIFPVNQFHGTKIVNLQESK